MKSQKLSTWIASIGLGAATSVAPAQILVNDTWLDGSRNEQNLPTESQWFASTGSSLTTAVGTMTALPTTSSRMWMTYFTSTPASPVQLAVNETLRVTAEFTPSGVAAQNSNRGLRIGLFDYSGGTRIGADSFSTSGGNGAGVTGYLLNMNFGQAIGVASPLEITKRVGTADANLMGSVPGTGPIYSSLGAGPSLTLGDPMFVDGISYTLEFSITRTGLDAVDITTRFFGANLNIAHTVSDVAAANLTFDAFAIRADVNSRNAEAIAFSRFTVETLVVPEPTSAALLGLGLLGIFSAYRRQQK